ncbi:MAG: uracil-DNA glycosylase family protein [Candidatus Njordarchaeia archaeon]
MFDVCEVDPRIIELIEQCKQEYKPRKVKVLFIGEAPPSQPNEIRTKDQLKFFYNPEKEDGLRKKLKELLSEVGFKEFENLSDKDFLQMFKNKGFYLTDAIKCPKKMVKKSEKKGLLKTYKKFLLDEIEKLKPEIVFILGWVAMDAIGVEGNITDLHGSVIDPKELNIELPESVKKIIVSVFPSDPNKGRVEDISIPFRKLRDLIT